MVEEEEDKEVVSGAWGDNGAVVDALGDRLIELTDDDELVRFICLELGLLGSVDVVRVIFDCEPVEALTSLLLPPSENDCSLLCMQLSIIEWTVFRRPKTIQETKKTRNKSLLSGEKVVEASKQREKTMTKQRWPQEMWNRSYWNPVWNWRPACRSTSRNRETSCC